MHPLLENISIFTWMDILESNEKCYSFLEDLVLIPRKNDVCPKCPKCSGPMAAFATKKLRIGWRWKCKKYKSKKNLCYGVRNPLDGTFFENYRIPLTDMIGLMFGFLLKIGVLEMKEQINCWRNQRKEKQIGVQTITEIYARFKEIIFTALRRRGEFSERTRKADVTKLFQMYAGANEFKPRFRYLVFQFLMDIKSIYPCLKEKKICDAVEVSASVSTDITNVGDTNNETGSTLSASSNVSSILNLNNTETIAGNAENLSSASTVSTISDNASTIVSIVQEVPSTRDVKKRTSNHDADTLRNLQNPNDYTAILENVQPSNRSTDIIENDIQTRTNIPAVLNKKEASNSNATAMENMESNNSTAIENVETSDRTTADLGNIEVSCKDTGSVEDVHISNDGLSRISFPFLSTEFLNEIEIGSIPSPETVLFTNENMDID